MTKQLWFKIGFSFFVLFFVVMAIVGVFSGELMKSTYIRMKEKQLTDDAAMLLHTTDLKKMDLKNERREIKAKLLPLSEDIAARITVIDKSGAVVADTKENEATLSNHFNRPEVKAVLKNDEKIGKSMRKSTSVGYSMLYVALPIQKKGTVEGVIRISISLKSVETAVYQLWTSLLLIFTLAFLIIAAISVFIARKITWPIKGIIRTSADLASGKYDSRVYTKTNGELRDLSTSVNKLAESLETQINKMKENTGRLHAVVDNLMSGVILINKEKHIMMTNRALNRILNEEKMLGKTFYEVVKSYSLSQLIEQTYITQTLQQQEITLYFPREVILDASVSPILLENGEMTGVIVLLHDITQIRRLENVRSEFVANVSHELKTPVTALKGFAETLLDGAMNDEVLLKQFLTIIKDESDRLHRLIMDILELSKIERKIEPLESTEINLDEVAKQSLATVQNQAAEKQITITMESGSQKPILVKSDQDRMKQILINLLANAVIYTPSNGEICLYLDDKEGQIEIIVTDTGIGIPKEDLHRIFERFYRVDKARSRHSGGTGLGLSIVKHLVEDIGGFISVESTVNVGSTFTVVIPKQDENQRGKGR